MEFQANPPSNRSRRPRICSQIALLQLACGPLRVPEQNQPAGILHWQGPQDQTIDQREDRSVGADAERE